MSDDDWADFASIRSPAAPGAATPTATNATGDDAFFEVAPVGSTPAAAPGGDDFWAADFVSATPASNPTPVDFATSTIVSNGPDSSWAEFASPAVAVRIIFYFSSCVPQFSPRLESALEWFILHPISGKKTWMVYLDVYYFWTRL
jgi:hypothetical protein